MAACGTYCSRHTFSTKPLMKVQKLEYYQVLLVLDLADPEIANVLQ